MDIKLDGSTIEAVESVLYSAVLKENALEVLNVVRLKLAGGEVFLGMAASDGFHVSRVKCIVFRENGARIKMIQLKANGFFLCFVYLNRPLAGFL